MCEIINELAKDPIKMIRTTKENWKYNTVVQCLPSMYESMRMRPSVA